MSKTSSLFILSSLLTVFILIFNLNLVTAQTSVEQAVTIEPAFQNIEINGQTPVVSADLTLHNTTLTPLTFEIFSQDIKQVDDQGNIALIDKPDVVNTYALAEYVRVAEPKVTLEPGQEKIVPVEIINQDSMSPGGHYAAVIVRAVTADTSDTKIVVPALTSILLVHKEGGDQYQFTLNSVETGLPSWWYRLPNQLQLTFENQGNVHVIPQGQVKLTDIFGRVVREGIVNENTLFVLPETQKIVRVELQQIRPSFPIMMYSLTIDGQTKVGQVPFSYTASALYISPLFAGLVLTAIGVILFRFGLRVFNSQHE